MDYWTWFHDLSRRWDGSFLLPSQNDGGGYTARGPLWTMGGQAMVYALPLKLTRLCGATESPFDVSTMPSELAPIKALVHDEADIYLNGVHIARILTERAKGKAFTDFDVTSAGLPALKQGTNVLAVKAVRDGGHLDVGIMGVKRP